MAPRGFNRYMLLVGAGTNRKLARLTDSERCAHFLGVLSVAAQSPVRGYLFVADGEEAGEDEVAIEAGVPVRVARTALEKLKRVGILVRDDDLGGWFVHDWDEINPTPKIDRTNADRQRDFRARNAERNGARNGGSNAPVTPGVTPPEVKKVEVEEQKRENNTSSSLRSDPDPIPFRLCERLAAHVRANDPKADPHPDGERWLTDMRLLVQDRGGDVGEVERIIDWCQADSFWRCNVLSPAKLRKQFTQLVLKAGEGRVVSLQRPSAIARMDRWKQAPEYRGESA